MLPRYNARRGTNVLIQYRYNVPILDLSARQLGRHAHRLVRCCHILGTRGNLQRLAASTHTLVGTCAHVRKDKVRTQELVDRHETRAFDASLYGPANEAVLT